MALDVQASDLVGLGLLLGALEEHALTLVLDDFHYLDDSPEIVTFWEHLLRFRPAGLSLIILSRTVPLLGFAALTALDEVRGVGYEELAFTGEETAALLDAHGLPADDALGLARRSGGWATGALLLARAAPGRLHFLHARVEVLMEHLGGEVMGTLPDILRQFLPESAALGPATPEDADAILGRHDSAALYGEAVARGLFVERDGAYYRYHDLFAEYLVETLKEANPDRLRAIRQQAASWWWQQGDAARALEGLAASEEWDQVADFLDAHGPDLWAQALGSTILTYEQRLPSEYRTARLMALAGHARAQRGEYAEALDLADMGMAAATNDAEWLSAALLRVETLVYLERYDDAIRSAGAVLRVAQEAQHSRAESFVLELRGASLIHIGDLEAGRTDLSAVLVAYEGQGDERGQARVLHNLATQLLETGQAAEAAEPLQRAESLLRHQDTTVMRGQLHISRALLHLLTGDPLAAREEAAAGIRAAEELGMPLAACEARVTVARAALDAGQAVPAADAATAAQEVAERLGLERLAHAALRLRIAAALLRRDRPAARRLLDEARSYADTEREAAQLRLLEGQVALRSGAYRTAAPLLQAAGEYLERETQPHDAARAYLLCAEAYLASGAVRRAEAALNDVAALVLPAGCDGYLRPTARLARRAVSDHRLLRELRRDTHRLLDALADNTSGMWILDAHDAVVAPTLWLSPFGIGQIRLGTQTIPPGAAPAKARELLFYAARHGAATRDMMLDAVWEGELDAVSAFWNASRHLRRLLGEGSWARQGGQWGLRLPVQDESLRGEDLASTALSEVADADIRIGAAEQYLQITAPGSYLDWSDSPWVTDVRAHIDEQQRKVALVLAGLYARAGQHAAAEALWQRSCADNAYDEGPRLALIRHLLAHGQVRKARAAYLAYRAILQRELGEEPSPELRQIMASLV
jgi:ATP/maltotriose-dependent transcriptional regulator MalT/DNA-binding SARP family transcriptional activator